MATATHLIGKCLFQVTLPGPEMEHFVYEKVSNLSQNKLLDLLSEILDELKWPPHSTLQIGRLELKLGHVSEKNFEADMLSGVKQALTIQIQEAIETSKVVNRDRKLYVQELLAYFFQHGHLPWHVAAQDSVASLLEELLSDQAHNVPAVIHQWLEYPLAKKRFAEQLSSAQKQQIIQIFPKNEIPRALLAEPGIHSFVENAASREPHAEKIETSPKNSPKFTKTTTPKMLEETAPPHWPLLFETPWEANMSDPMTWNTEPEPSASVQISDLEIPQVPDVQMLFYYLEHGNLPLGSIQQIRHLEPILLRLLGEHPENTQRLLQKFMSKSSVIGRIAQQFSSSAHEALIRTFFPKTWDVLAEILPLWAKTGTEHFSNSISLDFLWGTSLRKLFPSTSEQADIPQILRHLAHQIALVSRTEQPAALQAHLLKVLPSQAGARKMVQLALGQLTKAEQRKIEQQILQNQAENTIASDPETLAESILERLLFRFIHGSPAWWDDTSVPTEHLLLQLAALADDARHLAFLRLYATDVREKWLPQLSNDTFEQILHAFWGDYAALASLCQDGLEKIAAEKSLSILAAPFRTFLLSTALQGDEMDSKRLIHRCIFYVARQLNTPTDEWQIALAARAAVAVSSGDIRYYPIHNVLREAMQSTDTLEQESLKNLARAAQISEQAKNSPQEKPNLPAYTTYPRLIQSELENISSFLHKGSLPLDAPWQSQQEMAHVFQRLLDKHDGLLLPLLRRAFQQPAAIERFLQYFPKRLYFALGTKLLHPNFEAVFQIRNALLDVWGQDPRIEKPFWIYIFTPGNVEKATKAAQKTSKASANVEIQTQNKFAIALVEGLIVATHLATQVPVDRLWQPLQQRLNQQPAASSLLADIASELLKRRQKASMQEAQIAAKARRDLTPLENIANPDAIFVHNAGLVLLSPFLPHYFRTLDMLEGRTFRDAEQAERAIHLLQYLATFQSETPEEALVLNKILCGLPIDTPVALGIELSETEINLSNELLTALLQRWEIMQNSSISNLCGAFLLREGRLLEETDRWTLHVENKPFDIVLDYLPWTMSMIKLPWMQKRIEVTWRTKP